MINQYYKNACAGVEVRKNLIALRTALKDEKEKRALAYGLGGDFSYLIRFLKSEDPKIRKNAALILGEMESEDVLPVLFDTYMEEKTLFIRSDYLQAIRMLDYEELLPELKKQLRTLQHSEAAAEEQKHRREEIRVLQQMILTVEGPKRHRFSGFSYDGEVILVTNRNQREVTSRQITGGTQTLLRGGIRVQGVALEELLPIRTWQEILIPIGELSPEDCKNTEKLGVALSALPLTERMKELHTGNPPYYYRLEWKGAGENEMSGDWIRKLTAAFEESSENAWINTTTDYEIEIRLIQRKDGGCVVVLKLYTLQDQRFRYRKEVLASSMTPMNAALTVELVRPYLKEQAQVLDPFCGTGTLLLERGFAVQAKNLYGLDIYGEAIEKARINVGITGMHVNLINRDFFTFRHEYLFDEIITDLPQVTKTRTKEQIGEIYRQFFAYAPQVLEKDALIVLYTTLPQTAKREIRKYPFYQLKESFVINERLGIEVLVIKVNR